ncbi:hypothetical protein INR49_019327 [Caranx melampygus]|nr:hypothetical protein INR49_019327 [Caranx melampygus]
MSCLGIFKSVVSYVALTLQINFTLRQKWAAASGTVISQARFKEVTPPPPPTTTPSTHPPAPPPPPSLLPACGVHTHRPEHRLSLAVSHFPSEQTAAAAAAAGGAETVIPPPLPIRPQSTHPTPL